MAYYHCELCVRFVRCPETQAGSVQTCPVCDNVCRVLAGDPPSQPLIVDDPRFGRAERAAEIVATGFADAIKSIVFASAVIAVAVACLVIPPLGIWALILASLYVVIRLAVSHGTRR